MKTITTQIAALYVAVHPGTRFTPLGDESRMPPFSITLHCEPSGTSANWQACVYGIEGPWASSDEDALRGLRDAMIDRCRIILRDLGAMLPAFEAMQKEESES